MVSFRQLIQSFIGFISSLCYFLGNGRVQLFLLDFFLLFLETVWTLLQTLKSYLSSSSLTEKGGGGYPRDTLKWAKGGTHLRAIDWYLMGGGGQAWDLSEEAG